MQSKKRKYIADVPELLEKWDFSRNNGIDVNNITAGSNKEYFWICKKGHSYQSSPKTQCYYGCPFCAGKQVLKGETDLLTLEPELCKEWDYQKNKLGPDEYTRSSGKEVYWKCKKCGHSWCAAINNRTSKGSGCPNCSSSKQTSFPEQAIYYYIKQLYPNAKNRIQLKDKYTLDIYIEEIRVAIEYNGYVWHRTDVVSKRDRIKKEYCDSNNIRLITVLENKTPCSISVDDNNIVYYRDYSDKTDSSLAMAIQILIKNLLHLDCHQIDLVKDRNNILTNYAGVIQEKSLATIMPSLVEEWDYKKNQFLTPERVPYKSNFEVYWRCSKGHSYSMPIDKRSGGRNCPYCSGRKLLCGYNDFETWCKNNNKENLLSEWDYGENKKKPSEYFMGRKGSDIHWICSKCQNGWYASILDRAHGKGCPFCDRQKRYKRVIKLSKDKKPIENYPSISQAARENNLSVSNVSAACRGKAKSAGGYYWVFEEDYLSTHNVQEKKSV